MGIITSLADFDWREGEAVDADQLLDDRRIALYCLDNSRRRAIFAVLPEGIDLSNLPFMYQAQFDHAEHLIALPYDEFTRLADSIPRDNHKLLCLHNIGRCGSTVLCRALNEIDGVIALSEPDVLTNFVNMREKPRREQIDLLRACFRWLCRPAIVGEHGHVVIKFRNQAAAIMDLYLEAAPAAQHLFMYRNVLDWLASFHRIHVKRDAAPTRYSRQQVIEQQASYYGCSRDAIERLAHPSIGSFRVLEGRAIGWLYMLERYLELRQSGATIAALRYEDLQRDRDGALKSVLALLGLPEAALFSARRAFASDAQAGTLFAREGGRGNTLSLPLDQQATVRKLLEYQAVLHDADVDLPGTIVAE